MNTTPGGVHRNIKSSRVAKPLKRGRACMNCRYVVLAALYDVADASQSFLKIVRRLDPTGPCADL